jgi:hypothetical protein
LGSVLAASGIVVRIDSRKFREPRIPDSPVSIDKKEGEFILEVTSAAIPTVDLMGKGKQAQPSR